jgi:hypothetical protein
MAKVRSRMLVIDASVAHASGDISMHPISRSCREFLQGVLKICHCMALSDPVREEWDRHQSRFARLWRSSMVARKKLTSVELKEAISLEKRIPKAESDIFLQAIMEKDRHLLETALVSEKRVVSLDERVRIQFRTHGFELPEVRSICWVNPSVSEEKSGEWLKAGAPNDPSRTLGFVISSGEK